MKDLSRRVFLRYMAVLGLVTFSVTSLLAKGSKDQYKYQETPKDGKICVDCMHFLSKTSECRMIDGFINPQGWCAAYYESPKK